MRFNPKAGLDKGRMGSGGGGGLGGGLGGRGGRGGGMRMPIPRGRGGRMGFGSILVVIVILVLQQCMGGGIGLPGGGGTGTGIDPGGYSQERIPEQDAERYANCETGEDANRSHDCARVAVENSLTDFWGDQLGGDFQAISTLTTFSQQVQTQCGAATSDVGPFYCPADHGIYLDTTFFDQVLEQQLGGPDGGFVEFYVLAHEYGHHISNLLGFMGQVKSQQGPQSDATRLELQADCYAGMWAHHATSTEDAEGNVLVTDLTQEDIALALEAAKTVGDDHIQQKTQGQTNPETWNHGSSEQRMHWFTVGWEQGDLDACDTFAADQV